MADKANKPDRAAMEAELESLRSEHRDLDDIIARIVSEAPFDQLQMQRMKKRKLQIKDQIQKLEDILIPDIIA
ncbi:MAG: YdcH family protein [Pseudomonadota bacterium]